MYYLFGMRIISTFGLFLFFLPSSESVTEDDIKECGTYIFGRVLCTSVNSFYRECIVPGATAIDLIKLNRNLTLAPCRFKDTFGFRGNSVWVNEGCSGEFYVCYEGVRVSTDYPVLTVPVTSGKPVKPDVAVGSTSGGGDDVVLYIVIVVVVVLLVGLGLLVGCYVKRRQHRDRAKRLAEKRQASIDQKAQKSQIEENTSPLPMATRSLSLESLRNETSSARSGGRGGARDNAAFEHDGSVCSSQSTMSEFTSVSAQTAPGNIDNFHQTTSANKRGSSSSDITPIGAYTEISSMSKQNRNVSSCHSSLESIREVCNKYKMVDIPIERRYKKKSEHDSKYSTVGFSGTTHVSSVKSGTMTLPVKRTKTRALVHVNPPQVPPKPDRKMTAGNSTTSFEQHYQDPGELSFNSADENRTKIMGSSLYEECFPSGSDDRRLSTEQDEEYAVVGTCVRPTASFQNTKSTVSPLYQTTKTPAFTETDNSTPIYATVGKSCLKPKTSEPVHSNGSLNVSFEERVSQKKEGNNNEFPIYGGREYGPLQSFMPINVSGKTVDAESRSLDLKATKC